MSGLPNKGGQPPPLAAGLARSRLPIMATTMGLGRSGSTGSASLSHSTTSWDFRRPSSLASGSGLVKKNPSVPALQSASTGPRADMDSVSSLQRSLVETARAAGPPSAGLRDPTPTPALPTDNLLFSAQQTSLGLNRQVSSVASPASGSGLPKQGTSCDGAPTARSAACAPDLAPRSPTSEVLGSLASKRPAANFKRLNLSKRGRGFGGRSARGGRFSGGPASGWHDRRAPTSSESDLHFDAEIENEDDIEESHASEADPDAPAGLRRGFGSGTEADLSEWMDIADASAAMFELAPLSRLTVPEAQSHLRQRQGPLRDGEMQAALNVLREAGLLGEDPLLGSEMACLEALFNGARAGALLHTVQRLDQLTRAARLACLLLRSRCLELGAATGAPRPLSIIVVPDDPAAEQEASALRQLGLSVLTPGSPDTPGLLARLLERSVDVVVLSALRVNSPLLAWSADMAGHLHHDRTLAAHARETGRNGLFPEASFVYLAGSEHAHPLSATFKPEFLRAVTSLRSGIHLGPVRLDSATILSASLPLGRASLEWTARTMCSNPGQTPPQVFPCPALPNNVTLTAHACSNQNAFLLDLLVLPHPELGVKYSLDAGQLSNLPELAPAPGLPAPGAPASAPVLVLCERRETADSLAELLRNRRRAGHCVSLHAGMSLDERARLATSIRNGLVNVVISTPQTSLNMSAQLGRQRRRGAFRAIIYLNAPPSPDRLVLDAAHLLDPDGVGTLLLLPEAAADAMATLRKTASQIARFSQGRFHSSRFREETLAHVCTLLGDATAGPLGEALAPGSRVLHVPGSRPVLLAPTAALQHTLNVDSYALDYLLAAAGSLAGPSAGTRTAPWVPRRVTFLVRDPGQLRRLAVPALLRLRASGPELATLGEHLTRNSSGRPIDQPADLLAWRIFAENTFAPGILAGLEAGIGREHPAAGLAVGLLFAPLPGLLVRRMASGQRRSAGARRRTKIRAATDPDPEPEGSSDPLDTGMSDLQFLLTVDTWVLAEFLATHFPEGLPCTAGSMALRQCLLGAGGGADQPQEADARQAVAGLPSGLSAVLSQLAQLTSLGVVQPPRLARGARAPRPPTDPRADPIVARVLTISEPCVMVRLASRQIPTPGAPGEEEPAVERLTFAFDALDARLSRQAQVMAELATFAGYRSGPSTDRESFNVTMLLNGHATETALEDAIAQMPWSHLITGKNIGGIPFDDDANDDAYFFSSGPSPDPGDPQSEEEMLQQLSKRDRVLLWLDVRVFITTHLKSILSMPAVVKEEHAQVNPEAPAFLPQDVIDRIAHSVAMIFSGISSPQFPAAVWGINNHWGRWAHLPFALVRAVCTRHLISKHGPEVASAVTTADTTATTAPETARGDRST
ncbi:hypothetical protein H696_00256 [Fonticula alba]|uniref:Uncharacterized protein n=1 Tax=Fonticula alba TaxID=691883 RepID=A0A058ZFE6_FONAL|nr:hypothetical protein H696_00256 [Fonticula alba]KCV72676.1 hypothetical protein H696_00256 [Fonticula alba]|eukprot:XP_009492377.1 hypothetical protein H696_00256 [Fonticula alba]